MKGSRFIVKRQTGELVLRCESITESFTDSSPSGEHTWNLYAGKDVIGTFRVTRGGSNSTKNWSVSNSNLNKYEGFGIGKLVYAALTMNYGILESDPRGTTSEDAARVWKCLKATVLKTKVKDYSGKVTTIPRYRLRAEKIPNII